MFVCWPLVRGYPAFSLPFSKPLCRGSTFISAIQAHQGLPGNPTYYITSQSSGTCVYIKSIACYWEPANRIKSSFSFLLLHDLSGTALCPVASPCWFCIIIIHLFFFCIIPPSFWATQQEKGDDGDRVPSHTAKVTSSSGDALLPRFTGTCEC